MEESIIVGLLQNTAILLAFSLVYDFWWNKRNEPRSILNKIYTGFVIGTIGIILMLTPWIFVPGLVFDTRSVILSVSGLFFGKLPTLIAMVITGVFRYSIGGDGTWMGIAVIVTSGLIGMAWNKYRPLGKKRYYLLELTAMGYVVHIVMLGCTIFLPSEQTLDTLKIIAFPNLTIYPAVTVLLGTLMFKQYRNWQNRKASEKLRESERRFSELLNNTFLFTAIVDTDAKITFCNKAVIDITGFSFEELSGMNLIDTFIPEDSREKFKKTLSRILEGEMSALNFETEFTVKNGSVIIVSVNCTMLRDENENVIGIAGIGENITKRKQAEADLINAKIKAEESDKLKSIFLANMSHEIRTPMNAIMGFSTLLGEYSIDESDKVQYIDIIKSSSNRLLQLINDIIDLSKIEAKQLKISNGECSLYDIFIRSTESFRKSELLLKKPDIKLILNYPEKYQNVKIISDGIRIQQVLDNLLSNAIKYTDKGLIETGCSIKKSDDGQYIEFYVKDTGIGIPKEMSKIVFEQFRQVEEGQFHEGAGLGLSISKGIVDLMGGNIWLVSEINAGSVFYFTLPYIPAETESVIVTNITEEIAPLKGKNIIIAEDDYNSFRYLQLLLNGHNANIIHAENGKILLDMVRESMPDLILLDINMPVMSGFEFLEEMHSSGFSTKIIAQTAYAMPDERERCLSSGCNGYISKPIKKAELFNIIKTVLTD